MIPFIIAGAIGYGIAKLLEKDNTEKFAKGGGVGDEIRKFVIPYLKDEYDFEVDKSLNNGFNWFVPANSDELPDDFDDLSEKEQQEFGTHLATDKELIDFARELGYITDEEVFGEYAEGGEAGRFNPMKNSYLLYEGQSILLKNVPSPKERRFLDKEIVIEKIDNNKILEAFVRETGEKVPFFIDSNLFKIEQYADGGSVDMNKHIWEGWTIGAFIDELEPQFNMINSGRSWQKPFKTRDEVKKWAMDNQPYYKKYIPEVVDYFWAKSKNKNNYKNGGSTEDSEEITKTINKNNVEYEISLVPTGDFTDTYNLSIDRYSDEFGGSSHSVMKILSKSEAERMFQKVNESNVEDMYRIFAKMPTHKNKKFAGGGMTNEDILRSFLTSERQTQTNNLATFYSTLGSVMLLRNYGTLIAKRNGRRVEITNVKYSKTTSAITNRLKALAEQMGYNVSYVSEFAEGGEAGDETGYRKKLSKLSNSQIVNDIINILKKEYTEELDLALFYYVNELHDRFDWENDVYELKNQDDQINYEDLVEIIATKSNKSKIEIKDMFNSDSDKYAEGGKTGANDIGEDLENYSNYDEFYNVVFDYIKREENLTEEETKDICNVNESIIEAEFDGGSSPRFTGDVVLGYLSNERAYKKFAKGGKTGEKSTKKKTIKKLTKNREPKMVRQYFDDSPYSYAGGGQAGEYSEEVEKILENLEPEGVKFEGNSREGFSVLVKDKNSDFSAFVDVYMQGSDVTSEWNQYIFAKNNSKDMLQSDLQDNVDIFDYFTSEAIQYLQQQGAIKQDDKGDWSYTEKYAEGGEINLDYAKKNWDSYTKDAKKNDLIEAGYSKKVAKDLSSEAWESLEKQVQNDFKNNLISSELESMKSMMESLYTYDGFERGGYGFNRYLSKYIRMLGEKLFNKTYNEYKKELEEGYYVDKNVHTDSEGLTYNSLKKKYAEGGEAGDVEKRYGVYNYDTKNVEGYFDDEIEAEEFASQFKNASVYEKEYLVEAIIIETDYDGEYVREIPISVNIFAKDKNSAMDKADDNIREQNPQWEDFEIDIVSVEILKPFFSSKGYMVFNYTDDIYATDEVFKTKKIANDFIKEFISRFAKQGYYRDNQMNKIDVEDIALMVIPSDYNPL